MTTGAMLGMSFEAMIWALEQAPDVPAHCVGVLMGLANHADAQGRGAYAGQKLIAGYARKTDRAVRNDLTQLIDLKLIREGDQSLAAHIPADCRPVVFDLAMERKCTSARQSASGRNQASPASSGQPSDQAPDQQERGGSGSVLPGGSTAQRERKPASYKPNNKPKDPKNSSRPKRDLNEGRDDAMRLCIHLADRVEGHGSLRPSITKKWLDSARLLLDKDGRTEQQAHDAIDWCQDSSFWHSNVMSMPKLRDQYDQLRLKALEQIKRDRDAAARASSNGHAAINGQSPGERKALDAMAAAHEVQDMVDRGELTL